MCKVKININEKEVHYLEVWFSHYVQTFKEGDKNIQENIILKENHTELGVEIFKENKVLNRLNFKKGGIEDVDFIQDNRGDLIIKI